MSYRLTIINRTEKTYIIIAKSLGGEFGLGNVDLLHEFLEHSFYGSEFEIGTDIDTDGLTNFNKAGKWEYYGKKDGQ